MKRRLMVLFLSLSAATVFAAGQKKNRRTGRRFFFLQGARPCGAPGFPLQFAASRAFPRGKAARFALRLLSVGSSFPLQSLAPSAALTAVCESAAFKAAV